MRLGTAIECLFDNYVYASDKEWIRDKVAWALYQTWKAADNCESCRHWWVSEEVCLLDDCQYEPEIKPQECYLKKTCDHYGDKQVCGRCREYNLYSHAKTEPQIEYPCNTCANKGDHDGECSNCVADSERIRWKTPSHYKPKQGEWTNAGVLTVQCSNCKSQFHELEAMNFCPNCGAKMKGADDEID